MKKQITEIKAQIQALMNQIANLRPEEIRINLFMNIISELNQTIMQLDLLQKEVQQAEFEKAKKVVPDSKIKDEKTAKVTIEKKFNEN